MKAGKIKISEKLFLDWMQFPLANILDAKFNVENREIEIILEDDEMPEQKEGESPKIVTPTFITYEDGEGHKASLRQKIEPCNIQRY